MVACSHNADFDTLSPSKNTGTSTVTVICHGQLSPYGSTQRSSALQSDGNDRLNVIWTSYSVHRYSVQAVFAGNALAMRSSAVY
ncbi:hypothetical protein O988_08705 [Pseudogymnoascus sp. VKM F-3808]|nr:hypothetical protein O988_08705 [Pseudogymnoascus sp. VKM F-3808]